MKNSTLAVPFRFSIVLSIVVSMAVQLAQLQTCFAAAGGALTLEQALQNSESSPSRQKSRATVEEAEWKRVEESAGFLPTVSARVDHLYDKKYLLTDVNLGGSTSSFPSVIPTTSYTLGFSWTVFDGLANVNRWQSAKGIERAARLEDSWDRFRNQREVILRFYQAIAARSLQEVANQNLKTLEDHQSDVALFKSAGLSTKFDVLRLEVQTSVARSEVLSATDTAAVAKVRLHEVMAVDNDDLGEPTGEMPILQSHDSQALPIALTERGDLKGLQERAEALNRLSLANGRYWVPKIAVLGQYQNYNNRNDAWSDSAAFRDAYSIGVQASWTFDGIIGPAARDGRSAAQSYQAERTYELAKRHALTERDLWHRKFLFWCEVYRARESELSKSSESVRIAREGRRAGTRTNSDLLDAELELFRARAGKVQAQIGAIEAMINLELVVGKEIYSFVKVNQSEK